MLSASVKDALVEACSVFKLMTPSHFPFVERLGRVAVLGGRADTSIAPFNPFASNGYVDSGWVLGLRWTS